MIHWQITFEDENGTQLAQRPFQFDGDQTAAETAARAFWTEFDYTPVIRAYPLAAVDENGCHATDGQRLVSHEEHRAELEREKDTL
jgi:hypothetical protein